MRRTIPALVAVAAQALACSGPAAPAPGPILDTRPRTWAYRNEEQWIVSDIVGSIAAMAAYARHPAKPTPGDWAVRILSASESPDSGVSLRPLQMRLTIGGADPERSLDVHTYLFSPEAYAPLAAALLPPRDPRLESRLLPDEKLLAALLDLRAPVVDEQNHRVSEALEIDMLDAAAHEQAALVLGALALREAAGDFSDARPALSRIAAHLAVARALGPNASYGLAGRYAELILLCVVQRQREAIDKISVLESSAASPTERAWLRALRLRATGDWRILKDAKGASLLERLERFRARAERLTTSATNPELQAHPPEALTDWGRLSMFQGTPDDCGLFGSSLVAAEWAEAYPVLAISKERPPPASASEFLAAYRVPPATGGVVLNQDRLSFAVIEAGFWGRYYERHLINAIAHEYACLAWTYGLSEDAVAYAGRARESFAGLPLLRLITRDLMHDAKDPDRGFREAIGLVEREPERVPAAAWTVLRQDKRYQHLMSALPDESLWFSTGFPRGTAYEATNRLHKLKTLRVVRLEDKAALRDIAPYDYWVVWAYIWKLCGEVPVLDIVERESGPLLDYDARLLRAMTRTWENDRGLYTRVGLRLCALDPGEWPDYAARLRALGDEAGALSAYHEMLTKTPNEVAVANNLGWLVDYEFARGRRDESLKLAGRAAATGSQRGIYILGHLLERMGRLEAAFGYMRNIQEHYQERVDMVAIYLRHRAHFKGSPIEAHVLPVLNDLFGGDMQSASLADFRLPPKDGALIKGSSERLSAAGLKQGAVIVAFDGIRVRNFEQYDCIRWSSEDPHLRLIAWQEGRYLEVAPTLDDRRLGVDMGDYKP